MNRTTLVSRVSNVLVFLFICLSGLGILALIIRLIATENYIGTLGWAGTLLFAQMWIRSL